MTSSQRSSRTHDSALGASLRIDKPPGNAFTDASGTVLLTSPPNNQGMYPDRMYPNLVPLPGPTSARPVNEPHAAVQQDGQVTPPILRFAEG